MRLMSDPDRMSRIIRKAEAGSLRSDLARWMAANHDDFASMLRTYRPRWEVVAEQLVAENLLPLPVGFWSDDQVIRREARKKAGRAAKRVWDRTHAKLRTAQSTKSPPGPHVEAAACKSDSPPDVWRDSSLLGHTPSANQSPPKLIQAAKPDPERVKREMARLLGKPIPDGE